LRAQERNAQTQTSNLNQHIHEFSTVNSPTAGDFDISNFIQKLSNKQTRSSSLQFCRAIFNKTSQEYLRRYDQYASFAETLERGKYNCLTGTALYAVLLNHFGIPFTIIETNYHIFLLASTEEGAALFEATDPLDGFVTDPSEIEQRLQLYKLRSSQVLPLDGKRYYSFTAALYQPVNLTELRGLLHYNVATEAYNNQDFARAIKHLDQAFTLYSSPRIAEFSSVLLRALIQSNLDKSTREHYISQVKSIRKRLPVMASRSNSH
jgi:hypothetical protein